MYLMDISKNSEKQKWMLSYPERQYLYGNDVNNEQKRHNSIVNKRLPNLCDRIQYLIDDIALLSKAGYLDYKNPPDENEQRLFTSHPLDAHDTLFDPRLEVKNQTVWHPFSFPEEQWDVSLGMALGSIATSITAGTRKEEWIDYDEVVWGLILSIYGCEKDLEANFQQSVKGLIETIEAYLKERDEWADHYFDTSKIIEDRIVGTKRIPSEKDRKIRKQLSKLRSDGSEYDPESFDPSIMEEIEFSVERTEKYLSLTSHLSRNTFEDTEIIRSAHTKGNGVEDSEVQWTEFQKSVTKVTGVQWNGVDGNEVFREVWMASQDLSSSQIKSRYNTRNSDNISDKRTVSKIMADLAGQDRGQKGTNESEKWVKNPAVEESESGGRRGREWNTTAFGDLIGRWVFDEGGKREVRRQVARLLVNGSPKTKIQQDIQRAVERMDDLSS